MCATCRTTSVSDLVLQANHRKRCRSESDGAAVAPHEPSPELDVRQQEAAALYCLSTGEDPPGAATLEDVSRGQDIVREMLSLEAAGLSHCGFCRNCMEGRACIRAANRTAANEGKPGALWAEQGSGLVGRRFEVWTAHSAECEQSAIAAGFTSELCRVCALVVQVDYKGQRVLAEVIRYDQRSARHAVQWYPAMGEGKVRGCTPGKRAWIDFCRDLVYREVLQDS